MSKGTLIWSFAELSNMDLAIQAIRMISTDDVRGQIDGNVYWQGAKCDVPYVTGICRGVAYATLDGSLVIRKERT